MEEDAGGADVEEIFTLRLGTPPTSPVTITMEVAAVEPAQVEGRPWTDPDITVTQSVVLERIELRGRRASDDHLIGMTMTPRTTWPE